MLAALDDATALLAFGSALLGFFAVLGAGAWRALRRLIELRELLEFVRDQMAADHGEVRAELAELRDHVQRISSTDEAQAEALAVILERLEL